MQYCQNNITNLNVFGAVENTLAKPIWSKLKILSLAASIATSIHFSSTLQCSVSSMAK